ncbi:MAG: hypothetical protein ACI8P9_001644 [Parasphingorhabdus sp.]|jgi:uncharacterized protein (DUF1330 family)
MSAYFLADVSVDNLQAYQASGYVAAVPGIAAKFGGKYVARGGEVRVLEGDWPTDRFIIVEFPDMAKLQAFCDSEEYAPWKKVRQSLASSKVIAVEGLAETLDVG